jgi:hypothetical protein
MVENPQLLLIKGPEVGKTFSLDEPTLVLGRHPRSPIVIDHPEVSRRHARLRREEEGWVIEDLNSLNGTFVNGQRLTTPHKLSPGDRVGLSEAVTLTFGQELASQASIPSEEGLGPVPATESPSRHPSPARSPTWDHRDRREPSSSRRVATPPVTREVDRGPDRTVILIAVGCVVLILIAVCAAVLLLSYLDVIPSLFSSVPDVRGLVLTVTL